MGKSLEEQLIELEDDLIHYEQKYLAAQLSGSPFISTWKSIVDATEEHIRNTRAKVY